MPIELFPNHIRNAPRPRSTVPEPNVGFLASKNDDDRINQEQGNAQANRSQLHMAHNGISDPLNDVNAAYVSSTPQDGFVQ